MLDDQNSLPSSLSAKLVDLHETVAKFDLAVPRRKSSVEDIANWFATTQGSCDPCGDTTTVMSTCTNIDTDTNPTQDKTKKKYGLQLISTDLQNIENVVVSIGNEDSSLSGL